MISNERTEDASFPTAVNELIASYHSSSPAETLEQAQRFTEQWPEAAVGWSLLAATRRALGQHEAALSAARQAAAITPVDPNTHSNLGIMFAGLDRHAEAEASYRQALALNPSHAEAHNNLGATLNAQGRPAEALAAFLRAVEIRPDYREAHDSLATTLWALGRLEDALAALRRSLELHPDRPPVLVRLATLFNVLHRPADAVTVLHRALEVDPLYAEAHNALGVTLNQLRRREEARESFQRALELQPSFAHAHGNLGLLLLDLDRPAEAQTALRRALEITPRNAVLHSNLLFALLHDETLSPEACFAEHRAFAERFERPLISERRPHTNTRVPDRPLRVGFVSGDLRDHPVAHFIEPIWAFLDPEEVEIWAYSNHPTEDRVSGRLRGHAAHWRSVIHLDDATLAEQIRADAIDILIDLSGHTAHNRLLAFARKPAPIQAAWIGYPGTTGLSAIDYLICDRFQAPHGAYEQYYTEHFARLPSTGAFEPYTDAPPVNPLPALENGFITFASFNRPSKLNAQVIEAWSRILSALPQARLLVGDISDRDHGERLIRRFARHGIPREQLDLRARAPIEDYLALHHEVDIALDCWPYSGGTTTHHALYMGIPVVTLRGPSRAHCQSAARLGWLGLDDWIANDVEAFVTIAIEHSRDLRQLAALRDGLRARWKEAPLRDHSRIARGLEAGLRTMWRRWCAGEPPRSFELSAELPFTEDHP